MVFQTHLAVDVMSLGEIAELLIAYAAYRTLEVPKAGRAVGNRYHGGDPGSARRFAPSANGVGPMLGTATGALLVNISLV